MLAYVLRGSAREDLISPWPPYCEIFTFDTKGVFKLSAPRHKLRGILKPVVFISQEPLAESARTRVVLNGGSRPVEMWRFALPSMSQACLLDTCSVLNDDLVEGIECFDLR
jgi:hypothetical protein